MMKRNGFLAAVCMAAGSLLMQGAMAESACASKGGNVRDGKPLKVLMIGNSFTGSVMRETRRLAKAAGLGPDIVQCGIGGCPLERRWSNVEKSGDKSFKPYGVSASLSSGDAKKFPTRANVTDFEMPMTSEFLW